MIMDRELIYHDRCCCLDTDNDPRDHYCRKRYYNVYDLKKNKYVNIAVCNDLIRLDIAKKRIDNA